MIKNTTFLKASQHLLALIKRELKSDKDKLVGLTKQIETDLFALQEKKKSNRQYAAQGAGFISKIPLLGSGSKKKFELYLLENKNSEKEIQANIKRQMNYAKKHKLNIIQTTKAIKKYIKIVNFINHNYANVSKKHDADLMMFTNKVEYLKRSQTKTFHTKDFKHISSILFNLIPHIKTFAELPKNDDTQKDAAVNNSQKSLEYIYQFHLI